MKKLMVVLGVALACSAQAVQTAGTLLVDLAATNVAAAVGTKIQTWPNAGSLGGAFTAVAVGEGPEFRTYGSAGTPALYFAGNVNSILAGMQVDTAITGTNSWTLETWINIPAPTGTTTTFFSWTYRGGGPDPLGLNGGNNYGPNNRLFEARWNTDAGNAIEHYGGNLTWNGPVPTANQWHHIVMTRDVATRMEYIYLDGVQVQGALMPSVDILPDGIFIVGGTQSGNRTGWEMFVTGYIGQVRVHTGFMPLGDAVLNYAQERTVYGVFGYSIWDNAATTAQPWEDPMNWWMGDLPEANNRVIINNGGGASLTTPAGLVKSLTLTEGALSLSGAAALEVAVASAGVPVVVAGEPGSNFTLDILEGSLTLRDYSAGTHMIIGNAAGATGIVNVTGGPLPAQLVSGRNILMAAVPNATAYLTIGADGSLTHTETDGWVVVGHGGYGKVTVNGGSIKYQRVGLVHHGGTGILELNSGEVIMPGPFVFSDGTAFTDSQAIAYLNGGLLQIGERLAVNNPAATNVVYFNGGTVRYGGAANRGDFMAGLSGAYIQAGGAVFDIPNVNDTWVGINQAFEPDPALGGAPDGGFIKRGGGLLILGGANTFTGDIAVEGGYLWFNLDALTNCTGTIRMDSPDVGVGLETGGHVQELIDRIATDAVGQVMLFPENAGDTFDFSNHPGLALGAAHRNVTFTGTLIPYSADHCYTFAPYSNGSITFNETIADGASVLLNGIGTGSLTLGGNNTYTNGTVISGGKLVMAHPNALGTEGGITIRNGGALKLQAAGIDAAALLARITPDSHGYILLGTAYVNMDFDMRGYPDLYIGTDEGTLAYNGVITPDNDVYRLGGGNTVFRGSGNQGFVVTNLTDGASTVRRVVIDGAGIVHIRGADTTYSGGLTVTNNGVLYLSEDRAFGEPPAAYQANNVRVDGGVIRVANVTFTTHANRGLVVGDQGLEWHPWSNCQLTWAGGVSGSGPMSTSDGGSVFLGGTNNTWDGIATLNSGATIGAGDGANLSWNTDAGFYGINGFFGINYNEDFTWSGTFGRPLGTGPGEVANLGLRKLGTGTLFADVPQVYTQQTRVENGMLKVIDPDGIPHGEVSVYAPGVVDVNGHNLTFAKLHNVGNVIDSDGAATELTVGDNGNFALEAQVVPSMILRKVGTGTAVLNGNATSGPFEVDAGNISMSIQSRTPNTTHLNGASGLLFSVANPNATPPLDETRGLKAHYYQFASSPGTGRIGSIDQIRALMADNVPVLVTDTLGAGETFDFGNNGRYFPPPFDTGAEFFAALYSGYFHAETAGTYCFGLLSDDGSTLYLDGKQIINNNRDQAYGSAPVSNTVYLTEGLYPIVIGFYQGGSDYGLTAFVQRPGEEELAPIPQNLLRPGEFFSARVDNLEGNPNTRLTLSGPSTLDFLANTDSLFSGSIVSSPDAAIAKTGPARQTLTSDAAFTLGRASVLEGTLEMSAVGTIGETLFVDAGTTFASTRPFFGLLGRYYGWGLSAVPVSREKLEDLGYAEVALADSPEYVMSVITPSVFNFNNNGNGFPPPYNAGAECFVVLWKGHINLPADGTYTFYTASDDGSMLFIDREVVVRNNQDQAVTERSGTGYFTAGWHEIAIAYYQGGGGYGLFANIEGPGLPKQYIPNSMLRMSPYMTAEEATLAPMLTARGRIAREGTVDLASIGTLGLAPDGNYTFAGGFAGDRFSALVKTAPGIVTLTGDNSAFCGTIYIADGGIALAGNGTLGNARIVTGSDGIVAFDGEGASRFGGTIEGPGTLRFIGSGDATLLHGLDNFSGTVEFAGGQSLTLTGPWMNMLADQIQGAPSVTLTDGATLALTPGGGYPPDITASNAFISLAITNASSVWSLDKLHIQADGDVTVVCSGLWGEYYDLIEHNTSVISNAFLSVADAETFLGDPNNATFSHKASTWEAGPTMDFGYSARGDVHFPGYAPDAEYFAAIFRGQIRIPEMRQYCFATVSDDFSMVFIDGNLVVDNNGTHDMWRKSGYVTLDEGLHDIVILYCQCGTGLGFRFEMSADGADALAAAPNHLLFSHVADIPPYTLNIADLGVENAGTGSLILTGPGTLGMSGLWFDDGALLDVTAANVQVTGSTLTATVSEDIPKGKLTLVGDLTKTSGLNLAGITRTVIGPDNARLIYRNGNLYISRVRGTVLILR